MRSHARAMADGVTVFLLCGVSQQAVDRVRRLTTTPTPPAQTGTGTADSPLTVFITNSVYAPNPLTVKVGQFVNFKNNDQTVHSATFDNGTYESGDIPALSAHDVPVQMTATGTFTFHCRFHGEKGCDYRHAVTGVTARRPGRRSRPDDGSGASDLDVQRVNAAAVEPMWREVQDVLQSEVADHVPERRRQTRRCCHRDDLAAPSARPGASSR